MKRLWLKHDRISHMKKHMKKTFALIPLIVLMMSGCASGEVTNKDIAKALDPSLTPTASEQIGKTDIKEAGYCSALLKDYRHFSQINAEQEQVIADESDKDRALTLVGEQQKSIADIDTHTSPYRITDNDELNKANKQLAPMNTKLLNAYIKAHDENDPSQIDSATEEWGTQMLPIAQYCYGQEE